MLFVLTLSTTHIKGNNVLWPSRLIDFSDTYPQTMPTTRARVIRPLFLPRGAQIKIEYNPHWPSIRTIVWQVETLGYWVSVRPHQGQWDIRRFHITTLRRTCLTYLSTPVRSPTEQGRNCNGTPPAGTHQFSRCGSHKRPFEDGSRPPLESEDPSLDFYGLIAIQYQGEIILWLQREYGLHVQVKCTLYEDYLVTQSQCQNIYPKCTALVSDLLLLNQVIKSIVHNDNDVWYLPENPEFEYGCLINIRGSIVYFTIPV